jgi:hypothetical protein
MEQEENVAVDDMLVIFEADEEEPYKVSDSSISFDVNVNKNGIITFKGGEIKTSYFIRNNEITSIDTWRYQIRGIHIYSMHFDSIKDEITYKFTADGFTDKTLLDESELLDEADDIGGDKDE